MRSVDRENLKSAFVSAVMFGPLVAMVASVLSHVLDAPWIFWVGLIVGLGPGILGFLGMGLRLAALLTEISLGMYLFGVWVFGGPLLMLAYGSEAWIAVLVVSALWGVGKGWTVVEKKVITPLWARVPTHYDRLRRGDTQKAPRPRD